MARIKIEGVIDHLDYQMRRALEDSVEIVTENSDFDTHELFREFRRAVSRKCSTWERVPDRLVEKGD